MPHSVLIADDDPGILRLLEKYLSDNNYSVLKASNGREAMGAVLAEAPPIVITDWSMPEMDGIELCRALREHEGVRFVYVIIITAHTSLDRLVEAFDAGADDFLTKPINREELLARLRAASRICRLEEDLAKRTREIHRLNAEMAVANEKLGLANDKLKRMATTDELTDLVNRREAMNKLHQFWASSTRYDRPLSCIMLDIDHFKKFNDIYGHATGDAVLRDTAGLLRRHVRTSDVICRIGGEEFLVLCPHVGSQGAAVCAEHLRDCVAEYDYVQGAAHLKVTISLGVAERNGHMDGPDALLKSADQALYQSKRGGRNRVTVYEGASSEPAPA